MGNIRKTIIKRKSVKIIKKIYTFLIIFIICFFVIGIIYIIKILNKTTIVSPSIHAINKNLSLNLDNNQINNIEQIFNKDHLQYLSVNKTSFGYLILLNQNTKVYFSDQKNLNLQITSLQVIQSHFTIEGKVPKSVDFRFDQPVVSF